MTQAPVEPRHKDMAAKAAGYESWEALNADTPIQPVRWSTTAHAQTLANDEAKGKALAEIWTRTCVGDHRPHSEIERHAIAALFDIQAIAAPYRASDPVAEALKAIIEEGWPNLVGMHRPAFDLALTKFRAFIEGDR